MRVERLSNGLRLILKENHSKNLIALCGYINGGSRTENDEIKGLSHYYEHIIFRGGSARQAELETRQAFQSLGDYGGYTSDDATCYYFTAPKENFAEALWRYCDALMNLVVTAEKVEKDRQSIIQEFHMSVSDQPWGLAYYNLRRAAYQHHPYGIGPIGLENVVTHAQLPAFQTFYQERYVPNQITLAVVGDFHSDEMLADIEAAFGHYTRGRDSFELPIEESLTPAFNEVGQRIKTELAYYYLGFHLPPARSGEMAAANVMARMLGAYNARLDIALKQQEQIAQDVAAFVEMRQQGSMLTLAASLKPEQQGRALEIMIQELNKIADELAPEEELERAKRLIENSHYSHYESFQNQAQGLCWHSIASDVYDMASWLPAIRAVNCEDIRRLARKYFNYHNATLSTVAPAGSTIESYRQLFDEQLTRASLDRAPASLQKQIVIAELPCRTRAFLRCDSESGRFAAYALLGGGQLLESPSQYGLSNFVAQMLLRGSARATREQLAQEIADLGLDIKIHPAPDFTEISLTCASSVKAAGLKFFFEILQTPSFPEVEIDKLRKEIITGIGALGDDSFTLTNIEFNRAIYREHPYGSPVAGDIANVEQFTRADLIAFHERAYGSANMLLAISGEADASVLERDLRALSEGWRIGKPADIDGAMPLSAHDSAEKWIEKESQQITFNWGRLALSVQDADALALRLATSILSFRLFYRHVYDEGIAYRMWTLLPMRTMTAPFYFQMGVAPANFMRAKEGIAREVEKLLNEPIPSDEFARAQATLIQRYYLAQVTCAGQASSLAHYTYYGFTLDQLEDYAAYIHGIDKAAVEAAARRYIKLDDMMLVAVGKKLS